MSLRFPHVTHLWWLRGCWPKNGIEERERERLKGETESGGWNGLEKGRRQGVIHHVFDEWVRGGVEDCDLGGGEVSNGLSSIKGDERPSCWAL